MKKAKKKVWNPTSIALTQEDKEILDKVGELLGTSSLSATIRVIARAHLRQLTSS